MAGEPESYDPYKIVHKQHTDEDRHAVDRVNPPGLGKGTYPNQPWVRSVSSEEEMDVNEVKPMPSNANRG